MAMEYIDREEAMRAIDEYNGYFQDQVSTSNLLTKIEAKCVISDVDAADVAPVVHGKWIMEAKDDIEYAMKKCSICGYPVSVYWGHSKFCPNCGAKMDKED